MNTDHMTRSRIQSIIARMSLEAQKITNLYARDISALYAAHRSDKRFRLDEWIRLYGKAA